MCVKFSLWSEISWWVLHYTSMSYILFEKCETLKEILNDDKLSKSGDQKIRGIDGQNDYHY